MAFVVYHKNKKTGTTYVYEAVSSWDAEKKQARNRQVCIGKLDPSTGQFIPSKRKRNGTSLPPLPTDTSADGNAFAAASVGAHMLISAACEELDLASLLRAAAPGNHEEILAMAWFLAYRNASPGRFRSWCATHRNPAGRGMDEARIQKTLKSLDSGVRERFLASWRKAWQNENEYVCHELHITTPTLHSDIPDVPRAFRERQRDVIYVSGRESSLPLWYTVTHADIRRHNLIPFLGPFSTIAPKHLHTVLRDSRTGLDMILDMLKHHRKFLMMVPVHHMWVQKMLEMPQKRQGNHMLDTDTELVQSRLHHIGDDRRRVYLHLFYRKKDVEAWHERLRIFLEICRKELEDGETIIHHKDAYERFFIIRQTPSRGKKITYNEKAIQAFISEFSGFYALVSNSFRDPEEAYAIHRDFDFMQVELQRGYSAQWFAEYDGSLEKEGIFLRFISLIIKSALRQKMRRTRLIDHYTVESLLEEMESVMEVIQPDGERRVTPLTPRQTDIMTRLGLLGAYQKIAGDVPTEEKPEHPRA